MSVLYPIPRGTREVTLAASAGQTVFGPIGFLLYDSLDIEVLVASAPGVTPTPIDPSRVTAMPASPAIAFPAAFNVTLLDPQPAGAQVTIRGLRVPERSTDVTRAGALQSQPLERELDKITAVNQELRRDVGRAAGILDGFQLDIETVNQKAAQAVTAADAAEDARDVAIAAAGTALSNFPSRSAAIVTNIPAPLVYVLAAGYGSAGDGGSAMYKRVVSEPTHQGKFQSADGSWWELVDRILRPEMFGIIGINAAGDTAAYRAMISVANYRGGAVECWMMGDQYLINGSTTDILDAHTFSGQRSVTLRLGEATQVRQRTALALTTKFRNVDEVNVIGGRFFGFAQTQIDASQPLTELNLNSSSGNNVAVVHTYNCKRVTIDRVKSQNHFGRDLILLGSINNRVVDCELVGVGPTYNRPIIDGHQGNGEDAAIYAIPTDYSINGTAWVQTLEVTNCRLRWHSFCIRTILNNGLVLIGNDFGETPGQYHIYDTESDNVLMVGNRFSKSRMTAVKLQYENHAGALYGPLYDANKPLYAVGDIVRAFSILWICKTAYSPGGAAFTSTNWNQHPRNIRKGGTFSNNKFEATGGGISYVSATGVLVDARNLWTDGATISGNDFRNLTGGEAIRLERCINSVISNNNILAGSDYGILGKYFSGSIFGNDIRGTKKSAIALSIAYDATFEANKFWDCGFGGTGDDDRCPFLLFALDANDPPDRKTNPSVFFRSNGIFFTGGLISAPTPTDCAGAFVVFGADSRLYWYLEQTYGTPTVKLARIDGTLQYKFRNHFSGYNNTSQNEPTFTLDYSTDYVLEAASTLSGVRDVLGTFIAQMQAKKVVK